MKKDTVKYKNSPLKGKRKLEYNPKGRPTVKLPLIGKTVYLDVKEVKHLKRLQHDLKRLGGTIEEFLSKDINYLITTQPRPKKRQNVGCAGDSPVPSPFNCDPSPSPANIEDRKVPTVTRGKALAEKARVKARETNNLVDNAEKWGVKIVTLEGAYKWIERELKKLPKQPQSSGKKHRKDVYVAKYKLFKAPFLKLENSSYRYRPIHHELDTWPRLNVDTPRGSCPFDGTLIKGGEQSMEERGELLAAQADIPSEDTPKEEKDGLGFDSNTPKLTAGEKSTKKSEMESVGGFRLLTAGEIRRQKEVKRKQERKRGYCECCQLKYEDLDKHVREEQHRAYIKDKSHYQKLDTLIQSGPNAVQFISGCLAKAVSLRKKSTHACQGEEVVLIGASPLKVTTPTKNKQQPDSKTHQQCTVDDSGQELKDAEGTIKESKDKPEIKKTDLTETSRSPGRNSVQYKRNFTSDTDKNKLKTYSHVHKRTSPRKSLKEKNVEVKDSTKEEILEKAADNAEHACYSPRRKSVTVQEKENEADMNDGHKKSKDTPVEEANRRVPKPSPKPNRCLSVLFDRENKDSKTKKPENSTKKVLAEVEFLNISKSPKEDENVEQDQESVNHNQKDETIKNQVEFIGSTNASGNKLKNRKNIMRNAEADSVSHDEVLRSTNDKCIEKSKKEKTKLISVNNEKASVNELKSSKLKEKIKENGDKPDQVDATKDVKVLMDECSKRVKSPHASDDFEVTLLRSMQKDKTDSVTELNDNKVIKCSEDKTETKSSKNTNISITKNTGTNNESKRQKNSTTRVERTNKMKSKKESLTNCTNILNTDNTEQNKSDKVNADLCSRDYLEKSENIENKSAKLSDLMYHDLDGDMNVFTKSLAERIKERARSRPVSDTSFNMDSSFTTHRSNSQESAVFNKRAQKPVLKNHKTLVATKKTSQAGIASRKVLSKYRARRDTFRRCEAGYQGDDEEDVQKSGRKTRTVRNRTRNVQENPDTIMDKNNGQSRVLKRAKRGSEVVEQSCDGKIDTENEQRTTQAKKPITRRKKFWYYVTESVEESDTESEQNPDNLNAENKRRQTRTGKIRYNVDSCEGEEDFEDLQDSDAKEVKPKADIAGTRKKRSRVSYYEPDIVSSDKENESEIENSNKSSKEPNSRDLRRHKQDAETEEPQSKTDKHGTTKSTQKRSKAAKFWYYEPEPANLNTESEDQVEILPAKLRHLKGRRDSSVDMASDIDTKLASRQSSRCSIDNQLANKVENESDDTNKGRYKSVNAKRKDVINKTSLKHQTEHLQFKKKNHVESKDETSEVEVVQKKKNQSKFWEYVPFVEPLESNVHSPLPKALKILKSPWNTIVDQNDSGKTRTRNNSLDRKQEENNQEKDANRTKDIYKDNAEDIGSEIVRLKKKKRTDLKPKLTSEIDTETDSMIIKNNRGRGKFWEYVPLDEPEYAEVDPMLPKELQKLKSAWNDLQDESDQGKTRRRHGSLGRRGSGMYREVDSSDETDSHKREGGSRSNRKSLVQKVNSEEDFESDDSDNESSDEKEIKESIPKTKPQKDCDTEPVKTKKKVREKFWEYVPVVEPSDDDDPDPSLPKELQLLKCPWNSVVNPSDVGKTRRKSSLERIAASTNGPKRERSSSTKRKTSDKIIDYNDDKEDSDYDNEKLKPKNKRKSKCENKLENNPDTEVVNKKKEREKFWKFVTVVEPEEDPVDPSLPKELQLLKSPWNTVVDQSDVGKRRRRTSLDGKQDDKNHEMTPVEDIRSKTKNSKENVGTGKHKANEAETFSIVTDESSSIKDADLVSVNLPVTFSVDRSVKVGNKDKTIDGHTEVLESSKRVQSNVTNNNASKVSQNIDSESESSTYSKKFIPRNENCIDGSSSPKFHKSKSGKRKVESRLPEKRSGSPVFHRSPPSKRRRECDETSEYARKSTEASASTKAVLHYKVKSFRSEARSPLKLNKVDAVLLGTLTACNTSQVKTPTKKIDILSPKSGYSKTPRENRRKSWKRKRSSENLNDSSQNSEISNTDKKKRRKLEKLKYKLGKESNNESSSAEMQEKKNNLLVKIDQALGNETGSKSSPSKVVKSKQALDVNTNNKVTNSGVGTAGCSKQEGDKMSVPLTWAAQQAGSQQAADRAKRNASWSLLSDRSASKLVSSEGDERDSFEGFTKEEVEKDLPSDLSYVECSDVDDSNHEVVRDKRVKTVAGEVSDNDSHDQFVKYLPPTFSSPGKRSDSSWLDACEDYMDKSLKKDPKDSSFTYNLTSPWRSPMKKAQESTKQLHNSRECSTPKKSASADSNVAKVDQDIEFNFSSPQKRRGEFSPLRYKNGQVIDTSTPHDEGSPMVKPSQKSNKFTARGDYSGLWFLGEEGQSDSNSNTSKQFKLLKKVSSIKKKYSLKYDASPPKSKKKKKTL